MFNKHYNNFFKNDPLFFIRYFLVCCINKCNAVLMFLRKSGELYLSL